MPGQPESSASSAALLPLDQLQGNVVHGYSFPVACFWFGRFVGGAAAARGWLQARLAQVTPGTRWEPGQKPEAAFNLAFTLPGLEALGVPAGSLQTFPADFRGGMLEQAAQLGDTGPNAPERWEFGNDASRPLHVLVALHAASPPALEAQLGALLASASGVLEEVHRVDAAALAPDPRREHFGFRDGFGQPSIAGSGVAAVPGQGTPLRAGGWADLEAGELLLGHDGESEFTNAPPGPAELGHNGTFLVFRKLHQDVAGFRRFLRASARQLFDTESEEKREWVASRLIGRWRSGAPVALSPDQDDPSFADDWNRNLSFDYSDDREGFRCPVGSHIRRMNPRAGLPEKKLVRTHRILRRGLPYGPTLPDGVEQDDGAARGVAFMALNASIDNQFRFVQKVWMNDSAFADVLGSDARDPLASDGGGTFRCFDGQQQPQRLFDLPRFVSMRGGGYFFVPSLVGLQFLARGVFP